LIIKTDCIREYLAGTDAHIPVGGIPETLVGVSPLKALRDGTLSFVSTYEPSLIDLLAARRACVLILHRAYRDELKGLTATQDANLLIFHDDPRSAYAQLLTLLLRHNALSHPKARLGAGTLISPTASIRDGVSLGKNCQVGAGAIINPGVTIGNNCIIGENAVIGAPGFGIAKDANGNNLRIPHLGGVEIGDNVEIGALATVASGTMAPTRLSAYVMIDDHVHVGHNISIGTNTIITAGAVIGGSTSIGSDCWIGLNATIRDGLTLGDGVVVGMGSIVMKDVGHNETLIPERTQTNLQRLQELRKSRKNRA
jgi:UDP-3-O-[3-hydroxymyristoyl] glucosamine N-acyltransferase